MSWLAGRFGTACVLALATATVALPCVCPEPGDLKRDFREADAVLAGRVISLELVSRRTPRGTADDTVATLQVIRRWKGPSTEQVRVQTCGSQVLVCTCGVGFQLGQHYLVFASGSPLETSTCDRTQAYGVVPDDPALSWLGVEDVVKELDALVESSEAAEPDNEALQQTKPGVTTHGPVFAAERQCSADGKEQ